MEIKLDALTWQEFNERKEKDVVILPIGSLEQHGPHLPLC
ncbi:MAG TPA: creatininase, partial [Clostridium sp.]|nr:creatininase [Clostridium sp.]